MDYLKLALWAIAGFAAYEAYSVATRGTDVFYGAYPIPTQARPVPTLEWGTGAAVAGYLAAHVR